MNRENRLREKLDFDRVKQEGQRWKGALLSLSTLRRGGGPSRFGFVVSKRAAPKAATRNLLKRRARAAVQRLLGSLGSGWDCVIVAQGAAAKADFAQLDREIRQLFAQAGMVTQQIETP